MSARGAFLALVMSLCPMSAFGDVPSPNDRNPESFTAGSSERKWRWDLHLELPEQADGSGLSARGTALATLQQSGVPPVEDRYLQPSRPGAQTGSGGTLEIPGFSERLRWDFAALLRSPADIDRRGWKRVGAGVALVGVVSLFDEEIRSAVGPGGVGTDLANGSRALGQEASFALLGATWLLGKATGKERYKSVARDGLEASIFAAGLIAPLGKSLTGRSRPREGKGPGSFRTSGASFPSGEVTQAFAIASVVSAHSERKWVKALAWGLATGVAWQRMELDGHWASDVTAGALIGSTMGRWVVRRHRHESAGRSSWSLAPQVGERSAGLAFRWSR